MLPGGKSFSEREEERPCVFARGEEGESHITQCTCLLLATKELDALQQVWEITRDWEENWNQWKTGRFLTLQTEAMETTAHGLFRRLTRLAKEYKVRGERVGGCWQAD